MVSGATRSSTFRLSEATQHLAIPEGIVSTGWPAVLDTCRGKLGVSFDPWQDASGRLILAKRRSGKLAAMVGGVGMSLPRQVGKTYLVGGMTFGISVNRPGTLTIWTAHHARTHGETFRAMQAFANRSKIAPFIDKVFLGSGDEEIRFLNGSRILFGARERGFGRGIPGVDILVADEAQILSDRALDDMLATVNVSSFGLVLYIGTPPRPEDNSEAFSRMRADAISGTARDSVWIEFGSDPGSDPHDRKQWRRANPSYPKRTPAESILRLQRKLTPDSFLREGLGRWGESQDDGAFDSAGWDACAGPRTEGLPVAALALACAVDMSVSSIVAAGVDGDLIHVAPLQHGPGVGWLVDGAKELQAKHGVDVVVDSRGPAAMLIPQLEREGVRLRILTTGDVCDACAMTQAAVDDRTLRHDHYPELDAAVKVAVRRPIGDRWAWGRAKSSAEITSLEGASFALWAAKNPTEHLVSAYADHGLIVA